jgi:hypothetical protein
MFYVFERFERAVGPGERRSGFGVGLWIVRQLAEAMGGTVAIADARGGGALFTVTLPQHPKECSCERHQPCEAPMVNLDPASLDGPPDGDCGWAADEVPVRAKVNGTTFRATYEVKDAIVLLASPEFGDASAALDGMAPEAVAARLLRGMAETAMAHIDVPYLSDDEAKPVGP